jgi:hypothetical protein
VVVDDGERVASTARTEGKMTFEVHLPELVWEGSFEANEGCVLL